MPRCVNNGLTVRKWWANLGLRWIDRALRSMVKKTQRPLNGHPKRILIANTANLGDVVIAMGVIPALKRQFPGAELGFLVAKGSRAVVEKHPSVKYVHTANRFWRIAALRYDLCVDLQPYFPNAIPLLHLCRIPIILGYTTGGFSSLLTHSYAWTEVQGYIGEMHLQLLSRFGIDVEGLPTRTHSPSQSPYIVAHMGSSRAEKKWSRDSWIQVIQQLPFPVVLTGAGKEELKECEKVAQVTGAKNLAETLSWSQFVETVHGARLLISVDSAAIHIAAESQTPTIAIFTGVTPAKLWAPPRCHVLSTPDSIVKEALRLLPSQAFRSSASDLLP